MGENQKIRFNFRLTDEDVELQRYFASIPRNQTSKTIRNMLNYAFQTELTKIEMKDETEKIWTAIDEIKNIQDQNHKQIVELLKDIQKNGVAVSSLVEEVEEEGEVDSVNNSTSGLFNSFGVDFLK